MLADTSPEEMRELQLLNASAAIFQNGRSLLTMPTIIRRFLLVQYFFAPGSMACNQNQKKV
jgi:hypothetical protein